MAACKRRHYYLFSLGILCICIFLTTPTWALPDESTQSILKTLSNRFAGHANGHISYERKVYFRSNIKIEDIKASTGITNDWITSAGLLVWDKNEAYFENLDNLERYRIDAVNLMRVPLVSNITSGSTEEIQQAAKDYWRTYIYDETAAQQVIAYRRKPSGSVVSITRSKIKPFVNVDPVQSYNPQWNPVYFVFSPFIKWDLWANRCSTTQLISMNASNLSFTFTCGEERYTAIGDTNLNIIRQYEYQQYSGETIIGYIPLTRGVYSDFDVAAEPFPKSVYIQFFDKDPTRPPANPLDIPMAVTTYAIRISGIEYDRPEFSKKISLDEFNQQNIADYRFDEKNPIFYRSRPNLSDAEILAVKKKQDRDVFIRSVATTSIKFLIGGVVIIGIIIWYLRRRP